MSTILSFLSGRQITNNSGVPQSGAKLFHYREGTTTDLTVWTNDIATVAHAQPVVCDAGGFVPLIYVDDTFDWKVLITTSALVTLQTYDNIPKAVTTAASSTFTPALFAWTQITSGASPVTLAVADAGKAFEADTTGGSITFNLPSAASVGNGKGFLFKKTAAGNSMIVDPFGSEFTDGSATPVTITQQYQTLYVISNGATWYRLFDIPVPTPTVQTFLAGSAATYTPATGLRYIKVRMIGGSGGGAAQITNAGAAGTTTSFGSWTAILGNGGTVSGAGGAGGTGGASGTGIQIARFSGANGAQSAGGSDTGGIGGCSFFGGNGFGGVGGAGGAAKANTGSGGGGAPLGGGGGAGEYVEFFVIAPTATTYTVGGAGAGGAAGTNAGGNGAAGVIIVEEYYT